MNACGHGTGGGDWRNRVRSTSIRGGDASPPPGRGREGGRVENHGEGCGIIVGMITVLKAVRGAQWRACRAGGLAEPGDPVL